MLKAKPSREERIRRLKEVTADEDNYFPGVLGNPVMVAARWGLPLSKGYRDLKTKKPVPQRAGPARYHTYLGVGKLGLPTGVKIPVKV